MSVEQMSDIVANVSWLLFVGVAGFGVKFLRDMSLSIEELNRSMAVVLVRVEKHERGFEDHEKRIRSVEKRTVLN